MALPLYSTNLARFRSLARLAQSAERETLNLKVAGSTPALGFHIVCGLRLQFSNFFPFSFFFLYGLPCSETKINQDP